MSEPALNHTTIGSVDCDTRFMLCHHLLQRLELPRERNCCLQTSFECPNIFLSLSFHPTIAALKIERMW